MKIHVPGLDMVCRVYTALLEGSPLLVSNSPWMPGQGILISVLASTLDRSIPIFHSLVMPIMTMTST